MEFLKDMNWTPDVIHCNDWQTAMIPVLHKVEYKNDEKLKDIKTIISIHNLFFKGMFSKEVYQTYLDMIMNYLIMEA